MVSTATFTSIVKTNAALRERGIGTSVQTMQDADIALLRDIATTIWYDTTTASHLLFVDDDMGFEPELILDMLAFDQPLVGAAYPVRNPAFYDGTKFVGGPLPKSKPEGDFIEVDFLGTGILLIRRDVISKMLEDNPELSDTRHYNHVHEVAPLGVKRLIRCFDQMDLPGRARLSEDFSFCFRWRVCGGRLWAAIGHEIEHVGKTVFKGSFLRHLSERKDTLINEASI
jgi:hypothetical protein